MKFIVFFTLIYFLLLTQQPTLCDSLLDHMTGNWILRGKIAGKETVHDIEAHWVLGHQYIRIHETSREKNAGSQPEYEAEVFVGWDQAATEYCCVWLDIWGV